MCTTGAKLLLRGHEFVLFKNRDFTRSHFEDRVRLDDCVFGALGLETWDGSDPASDRFSGFSIGCNARLACCDSNVRMIPGGESYDVLVQEIVEHCTTVDEAIRHVGRLLERRRFSWGNLLIATADEIAALEVREQRIEVERSTAWLVRANHHVCLGATPDDDDTTTTGVRYRMASDRLGAASGVEDVLALLRSHDPDPQHSVCNHGVYNTVYSYIVHWQDGDLSLYVHQGHPCDGTPFTCLPIRFGTTLDLSGYPSAAPR